MQTDRETMASCRITELMDVCTCRDCFLYNFFFWPGGAVSYTLHFNSSSQNLCHSCLLHLAFAKPGLFSAPEAFQWCGLTLLLAQLFPPCFVSDQATAHFTPAKSSVILLFCSCPTPIPFVVIVRLYLVYAFTVILTTFQMVLLGLRNQHHISDSLKELTGLLSFILTDINFFYHKDNTQWQRIKTL